MNHKELALKALADARVKHANVSMDKIGEELKEFKDAETKANEVLNSGNAGTGGDVVESERLSKEILDLIPQYSVLLNKLPGDHGKGLSKKEVVPVLGEAGLFEGNSEWTDQSGDVSLTAPITGTLLTGNVSIEQGMFKMGIPLSKRVLNYSVVDLYAHVVGQIQKSAGRTIDAYILNGDTALTGNVNTSTDMSAYTQAQKDALYFLQGDNGIRKIGIANTVDIGAMDEDDITDMIVAMGDFGYDRDNLLFATSNNISTGKISKFDIYKDASKNGVGSTAEGRVLDKVAGVDLFTARDMPSAALATGKVSATPASNTTGQIHLVYTPSIQYGFGQDMDFEVVSVPGKGLVLVVTFEFGFGIASAKAGLGETVVGGVNVTL
jgi:hypothetical protein